MGGLTPPYEPSPRLYSPPPKRGGLVHRDPGNHLPLVALGTTPKGQNPKGNPSGVFPEQSSPRWPP